MLEPIKTTVCKDKMIEGFSSGQYFMVMIMVLRQGKEVRYENLFVTWDQENKIINVAGAARFKKHDQVTRKKALAEIEAMKQKIAEMADYSDEFDDMFKNNKLNISLICDYESDEPNYKIEYICKEYNDKFEWLKELRL